MAGDTPAEIGVGRIRIESEEVVVADDGARDVALAIYTLLRSM
jgi:hypothetical protein